MEKLIIVYSTPENLKKLKAARVKIFYFDNSKVIKIINAAELILKKYYPNQNPIIHFLIELKSGVDLIIHKDSNKTLKQIKNQIAYMKKDRKDNSDKLTYWGSMY